MHTKSLYDRFKALKWRHSSALQLAKWDKYVYCSVPRTEFQFFCGCHGNALCQHLIPQPKHSHLTPVSLPVMEPDSPSSSGCRKGSHAIPRLNTSCMKHQCCLLLTVMHLLPIAVYAHQQE